MANSNQFLHAASSNVELKNNKKHQFAMQHALMLYKQNAVYTFIPKNGCSTLRLSLAINNGVVKSPEDIDWIHKNNFTFCASLREAVLSDYKFVVLRCPYRRLVSVFLDKFIVGAPLVRNLLNKVDSSISPDEITFSFFLNFLLNERVLKSNIHWRNQADFLLYEKYDDYFQLENFKEVVTTLKQKIGFEVVDARAYTKHGVDGLEKDASISNAFNLSVDQLRELKSNGVVPVVESFYDNKLIDIVKRIYADDLDLYKYNFGASDILFD